MEEKKNKRKRKKKKGKKCSQKSWKHKIWMVIWRFYTWATWWKEDAVKEARWVFFKEGNGGIFFPFFLFPFFLLFFPFFPRIEKEKWKIEREQNKREWEGGNGKKDWSGGCWVVSECWSKLKSPKGERQLWLLGKSSLFLRKHNEKKKKKIQRKSHNWKVKSKKKNSWIEALPFPNESKRFEQWKGKRRKEGGFPGFLEKCLCCHGENFFKCYHNSLCAKVVALMTF